MLLPLFEISGVTIKAPLILDILITGYLIYFVYKYVRGTAAVNIFIGIILFLIARAIVSGFNMPLLTTILQSIFDIGILGLIIIFQPEIRRFLLMIGDNTLKGRFGFLDRIFPNSTEINQDHAQKYAALITDTLFNLGQTKTGALIVLTKVNTDVLVNSGQELDAKLTSALLENIFHKNAPLHDGAAIVKDERILAASCILPVTSQTDLATDLGLRHRAAIGVTENTNHLALVVSEQNGNVSYSYDGKLFRNVSSAEAKERIKKYYSETD